MVRKKLMTQEWIREQRNRLFNNVEDSLQAYDALLFEVMQAIAQGHPSPHELAKAVTMDRSKLNGNARVKVSE